MANKGSRQVTWIDGPHGVVDVHRHDGTEYVVVDPNVEQVIFRGTRKEALAFALGDSGHVISTVGV